MIGEPIPSNDRGFLLFGGKPIETSYGHTIRVQESSAAFEAKVWLFISESPSVDGFDPHLTVEQAKDVRDALDQFIAMNDQ